MIHSQYTQAPRGKSNPRVNGDHCKVEAVPTIMFLEVAENHDGNCLLSVTLQQS